MNQNTRSRLALALLAAVILSWGMPAPAWAQSDDDELEPDDPGDEVDLSPEPEPGNAPEGADENPDALPEFGTRREAEERSQAATKVPTGYPIELARRPIILAAGMSEVRLDLVTNVSPFFVAGPIEAHYGVDRQIQLGLAYGPGLLDADGFTTGKAVSADFHYLIFDWLAVQAEVPVLLDPFAIGVTVGAPLKFRIGENLALIGGHELISVAIHPFLPVVGDPRTNRQNAAEHMTNTELSAGVLRLLAGVIYQFRPNLAFVGETGILADNFSNQDVGVPLLATLSYSMSNMLDFGLRVGFRNLDDAGENFGATVVFALRI